MTNKRNPMMKKIFLTFILLTSLTFGQDELILFEDADSVDSPTTILAVGNVAKITLSWTNAATYDSVKIYRGTSTNPTTLVYTLAGGTTSKVDTPLTVTTIYYYRIKGKVGNNLSSYSSNASDTAGNYSGTELITDAINRGLEPVSLYTSDFSAGTDGWGVYNQTTITGNLDGKWGQDNVLGFTTTAVSQNHQIGKTVGTIGLAYKHTITYYIPASNLTAVKSVLTDGTRAGTTKDIITFSTIATWTTVSGKRTRTDNNLRFFALTTAGAESFLGVVTDSILLKDIRVCTIPFYSDNGNHSTDTSSTYKQAGSYSLKLTSSAAGNGTTNTTSLASTLFTAVTNGSYYRLQLYAYTSTASTVLTFKLGDITKTATISTVGMSVINLDFQATASTTGNILLYLDKAATVYLDDISLKGAQ